jgi:hypothetical protein
MSRSIWLPAKLAIELGWPDTEASAVVEYLNRRGMIEHDMGNQASITHAGVVEVEEALEYPICPTEHFPGSRAETGGEVSQR